MTYALGELVAERTLEAIARDGARAPVLIRIGKPVRDTLPGGDWACPSQIVGLGDEAVTATFGVDALQALLLSVYGLRLRLTERAGLARVRLDWLGQPGLGLAVDPEVAFPTEH